MNSIEKNVCYVEQAHSPVRDVPAWKRVLDVACIVLALPIVLPVSFLIGLLIKIVSPGPVLFQHERVGLRGRTFNCLKFRTMKVNADTSGHQQYTAQLIKNPNAPMVKLDNKGDSRLIPFGKLIRATGLDELPQLINVLRGEMSLVGPRPCLPYEFNEFLPWHRKRCDTLPGLTGLWQVSGKNTTTFERMMELDIWYARNKTVWLDLWIMIKTGPALAIQVYQSYQRSRQAQAQASAQTRSQTANQASHSAGAGAPTEAVRS
jgi:lipopolysaccharide/colanic/teichoic acid biosynthesis glycosyltransferase